MCAEILAFPSTRRHRFVQKLAAQNVRHWHRTGRVFESSPDLYWLFVKLLLANWEVFDWTISRHLTDLVAEPIWGSLWGHPSYELNKQAASHVDDQKYQCTTLRDFFITIAPVKSHLAIAGCPVYPR
jgi:hypothetical protein